MATAKCTTDKPQLRSRRQDLQEMLKEVGLPVDYWLPKLQEDLGVTCAQALQHLEERDLQKLKSQTQHAWEKRALEKLLDLSQPKSVAEFQETLREMIKSRQRQAGWALQELRALQSEGKSRQEEAVRRKEEELRQAMEIPEECWPMPEVPLKDVTKTMERHLKLIEQTVANRQNFSDRDVLRFTSGGLALQGIYNTCHQKDLVKRREELLRVPKEFFLFGSEQGKRKETKEFTSSEEESLFTETMEKFGFRFTLSAKGGCWGFNLEGGMNKVKHSKSKDAHQSHANHSYFCSSVFNYNPLASFHFRTDQLQLSTAALKELQIIEELLKNTGGSERSLILRNRTKNFFNRFGSHANQGPLHLGGIYCWKAISEGFKSDQLDHVKQQTEEALESYIKESYSGIGVEVGGEMTASDSHSVRSYKSSTNQQLQIKVQFSMAQIGGPPEANGIVQWMPGLLTSNKTWSVIDRELQLVPIWDIILSNHRSNFKDPFLVAKCLADNYSALTGLTAYIQAGEKLLSSIKEAKHFLDDVKSWEVSDPEEQLKNLIGFMQTLAHKTKGYDVWINTCLTNLDLQNFLIKTVNFYKISSIKKNQFIKSQFRSLLEPHVYKVKNFPQASSIMEWIYQTESEEHQVKTELSKFFKNLKEIHKSLIEVNGNESPETVEEAQRKATRDVTTALGSFLHYLREAEQPDMQLLLLSIAAGAGYQLESNVFQPLLGCAELNILLDEIQTVQYRYQELKTICVDRAQAFLVLKALTSTVGVSAISPKEKAQRLTLIRQHMEHLLSTKVAHVLTKFRTDHDWENLENNLRLLIDENYGDTSSSLQMDEVKKQLQSLLNKKKETYGQQNDDNNDKEVIEKEHFLDLLQRLGLEHHYPKRMSRADFHLIYKTSVHNTQPRSEQELPFYFLQKLLMLDCGFRHLVFKNSRNAETKDSVGPYYEKYDTTDAYEELFDDRDEPTDSIATESQPHIHPMDIQMAIFHCADDLARQYILSKLSICQFALPLVVPNPITTQIEFSLWSLRQVRKSWQEASQSPQDMSYSHRNQQMCCVSTPIVSFIRVGNGLSASKSQIMNSLLSKRKHDVFFHRHCRGSSKHCLLMEGVVEICWFCPGDQGEDIFDNCVAFTNLHGDAKEHRQQLSFLQDVSSLLVILMSASDDNRENQNLVRHLWQSSKPLICLTDDKEKFTTNNSGRKVRINIRNRNKAELAEELMTTIQHLLEIFGDALSIEDCSEIARKQGFIIDEDQRELKETKEKVQAYRELLEQYKLSKIKENLLPLQGQLWHHWCEKDKELYHLQQKGQRSIEQHKSEIEIEKEKIRRQQFEKAFPLNDLMKSVLQTLEDSKTALKLYFLYWLSVVLENLTIKHLKTLHERQLFLWSFAQAEKQKTQKSSHVRFWKNQIEAISLEILDCTFGIEHLLREVAQIYEALEDTSSSRNSLFLSLPQIAPDLMIAGIAVELMDGDTSYVPLKWVAAVFDKISEKIGDKRLFVLSVLGLQSSGKSTLLNALFGLAFTVSAGRCTKGAYMQLLEVDEKFIEELGFDFVLIVDTEGLRAPELNKESLNWENKLATFFTGLGNLTIINIFGDNPSEMQGILQNVVRAFLRIKQVKVSPRCIFVHQNVGEVTAKDETMEGGRRLEQRLDEMTALAAEQEECSNITCFSDVIKFDASSHVFYFAHLWDGNPPMAPPNPRYSHNVQELKTEILRIAQQESRGRIMKVSDVKFQIQNLWKALVSENCIFSVRNTQRS